MMLPQALLVLVLALQHGTLAAPQRLLSGPRCALDAPVVQPSEWVRPPVSTYEDRKLSTLGFGTNADGALPPANTALQVRIRVDEAGKVSSACVVEEVSPALARRVVESVRNWQYTPAQQDGKAIAVALTVPVEIVRAAPWRPRGSSEPDWRAKTPAGRPPSLLARIQSSSDVSWLREIAASYEGAVKAMNRSRIGQPRGYRTAAFARLGELDTEESRRTADEIEAAAAATVPADDHFSATVWQHPAAHFGDAKVLMYGTTEAPDGTTYAVVPGDLFGSWELFLTWKPASEAKLELRATPGGELRATPPGEWARPRPIPGTLNRGINNPFLHWVDDGRLEFTYEQEKAAPQGVMEFRQKGERAEAKLGPQSWPISLQQVLKDRDGDGWTDLEEERLGTNPAVKDSDGDGLEDGKDTCPNSAANWRDDVPEDDIIVRKAVFSTFGLSGSRMMLLPEHVTPVHLRGYAGPVIYGRTKQLPDKPTFAGYGGVFVSWEIVNRTADEATVIVSDYEGPLAAGGQNVYLRRQHGRWYVVGHTTTWVS